MTKHINKEGDFSTDAILNLLDRDITQGRVIPADAEYFERLWHLIEGVTVDLEQRLPDEDLQCNYASCLPKEYPENTG